MENFAKDPTTQRLIHAHCSFAAESAASWPLLWSVRDAQCGQHRIVCYSTSDVHAFAPTQASSRWSQHGDTVPTHGRANISYADMFTSFVRRCHFLKEFCVQSPAATWCLVMQQDFVPRRKPADDTVVPQPGPAACNLAVSEPCPKSTRMRHCEPCLTTAPLQRVLWSTIVGASRGAHVELQRIAEQSCAACPGPRLFRTPIKMLFASLGSWKCLSGVRALPVSVSVPKCVDAFCDPVCTCGNSNSPD